ncbi:MAG: bifunctional alpha/beta hydrolase/OsmC family protein [Deltaproteobacteria bacterium]|nr:bifunctional alpha/beta hydrolase/OsmC family protein [Deltaproteobacteria bacterium]
MSYKSEKLEFPGSDGSLLAARLDRPAGEPRAFALFAHCFTCTKDALSSARISSALAAQGIAVLRFDFTGLGGSGGDFSNTNFSSNVDDLVAAAAFLEREYSPPEILVGHSLGGAAVLAAAERIPGATAVATIGAPFDPSHVSHLFSAALGTVETSGEARVSLGGRDFCIRRQFVDDIRSVNLSRSIGSLGRALLVMHSPLDETVGIENATRIFTAARHPKSFVSLDTADHLLTRRHDSMFVADVLSAWASRYISAQRRTSAEGPSARARPGTVVVAENGDGPFGQEISASGHPLRADEPQKYGGNDSGPAPYDLLMASLGACTSMTLRMYAQRKNWPLGRVTVRLNHAKVHAEDCQVCEGPQGKIDRFERTISLEGPLDEAMRARLLEIADKCPVHKTLHSDVLVETRLDSGEE